MESVHMDSSVYQVITLGDISRLKQFESDFSLQFTTGKNSALHIAVQHRKKECVEEIYNRCSSLLWHTNFKGDTPLHIAARIGLSDIVKFFIDAKTLYEDVESGIVEPPELLLKMTNMEKDTALHEALRNRHVDVVKLLIEADPEFSYFANNASESPLYLAAEEGLKDIVLQILQTCPFAAHGGPYGRTALHAAVICKNSEIIKMLVEKKEGIIKEADDMGRTPLHYAAANWNSMDIVEQLLEFDSSATYVSDKDGMTPLHFAAEEGNVRVIKEMSERCPDCWELRDNRGLNFLHVAVENWRYDVVEYVLGTGEEKMDIEGVINEADNDGNTPLHLAVINEWKNVALLLCRDDRVNKSAMNKNNFTALDIVGNKWFETDYFSPTFEYDLDKFYDDLKNAGAILSRRKGIIIDKKELEREETRKRTAVERKRVKDQEMKKEWKKVSQTHLVVATLIATVTFAAGFTLPGGYISDKGHDQGMATLTRKAAFIAFVISDIIAMILSTFAVFIHFYMILFPNVEVYEKVTEYTSRMGFFCTLGAIVAMVVAFATGIYTVLANSHGLAITACVIGCSFYLFCGLHYLQLRRKLPIWYRI